MLWSEHRLIGLNKSGAAEREDTLDAVERGATTGKQKSPEDQLREHTEQIAKKLQEKAGSTWRWLLGIRQRSLNSVIWEEAQKRLQGEYEKLQIQNGLTLNRTTRKQVLERVYNQVLKEQMEYLQEQRNKLVERRKRVGAAAALLGFKVPPMREPKYSARTRGYLSTIKATQRSVGTEKVREMQQLYQVERRLFEELTAAGVPAADATSVIDDTVINGSSDLARKLISIFGADRTDLLYEARLLRDSKGKHRLLEATRSQKPVFADEKAKMSYLQKEAKPGTKLSITTPSGAKVDVILEHAHSTRGHHIIVRVPTVPREDPGAYGVLDTQDGVVTLRDATRPGKTVEYGLRGQAGDAQLAIETPLTLAA